MSKVNRKLPICTKPALGGLDDTEIMYTDTYRYRLKIVSRYRYSLKNVSVVDTDSEKMYRTDTANSVGDSRGEQPSDITPKIFTVCKRGV